MKINQAEVESSSEKLILTAMIVSSRFLKRAESIINPKMFQVSYARVVSKWCLDFFHQYQRSPQRHIEELYHSFARTTSNQAQVELIGDFLSGISNEYKKSQKLNIPYLLDITKRHFQKQRLLSTIEDIQSLLTHNKIKEAEFLLSEYKPVTTSLTTGVNPFSHPDTVFNAFETDPEPLAMFPGRLGQLVNKELVRDAFVGIMAGEKRGKSFLLQEIAYQAYWYRNNVVLYTVGDMSVGQLTRRLHVRLSRRHYNPEYCGRILIPVLDCAKNQRDECRMTHRRGTCGIASVDEDEDSDLRSLFFRTKRSYKVCTHCQERHPKKYQPSFWYRWRDPVEPLTWRQGLAAGRRLVYTVGRNKKFKLIAHPTDSVTVNDIERELDGLEKSEGFVPDVIVIDYADILAAQDSKKDFRHQENDKWKALRRMSLNRHVLVITATQADAGAYEQRSLRLKNFSEDKRKYAHVTAMFTLNQTDLEKRLGVARIGSLLLRESDFNVLNEVTILQCMAIGRPVLASY